MTEGWRQERGWWMFLRRGVSLLSIMDNQAFVIRKKSIRLM